MPRPEIEKLLERKERAKHMLRECIAVEDWNHMERVVEALQGISREIYNLRITNY